MNREFHRWHSPSLDRTMELLVFGHGGARVLVFPTSRGRFYEFEDRGMVGRWHTKLSADGFSCIASIAWMAKAGTTGARIPASVDGVKHSTTITYAMRCCR